MCRMCKQKKQKTFFLILESNKCHLQKTRGLASGALGPPSNHIDSVQAGDSRVHGSGLQHGRCRSAGQGYRTKTPNLIRGIVVRFCNMEANRPATVPPATTCDKHLEHMGG